MTLRIGVAALSVWLSCVADSGAATAESAETESSEKVVYQHGYAFLSKPGYPPDFTHFNYVNPDAPKGGIIRVPAMGNWDNFNEVALLGQVVRGLDFWTRFQNYVYDGLMEQSMDEPATQYGLLADGIAIGENYSWVQFRLRPEARWHDGEPITVDDVVFSFETYMNDARPTISTPLQVIASIEVMSPNEVRFNIAPEAQGNPVVPRRLGVPPIMPKHYWANRDITKSTIKPPLGSGPYEIGEFAVGRWIKFERFADYWAEDLPVMKGRYNFDTIKIDYFRDDQVQTEAVKANVVDVHLENVPRRWAQAYDIPAVEQGYLIKRDNRALRPGGLWWPIFWNMDQPRFQDIRVREALSLARPGWEWGSRRSYGFFDQATSFFHDSDFASSGLPSDKELRLLEPLRGRIPERVFTEPYGRAPHGEVGWHRDNIIRAAGLMEEAGWVITDGRLVHEETGEPFNLRFVAVSPALGRSFISYTKILEKLGIASTIKSPETSNWLFRMRSGDFDAGAVAFLPDSTPTLLLSNTFSSVAAAQEYSFNWSNLKDPAVDELIDHVYAAQTHDDFIAALRAVDRVLLWNFYWLPGSSKINFSMVYWDKFGRAEYDRLIWINSYVANWWWDEEKAARVAGFTESR